MKRTSGSEIIREALIGALLAACVMIALNGANPLTTFMGRNAGSYAYTASHMLRGETLYLTAWGHKPPMIFLINALGLLAGKGTRWGIWAVEFAFMLGAAFAGLAAMRKSFGLGAALIGSGLWLLALAPAFHEGNLTEEYALLFSFASLLMFVTLSERPGSLWLHAGLGLAFGMNFLLRPNNTGVQVAIFTTEALILFPRMGWRQAIKAGAATAAGGLAPIAAISMYFAARGAFAAYVEASYTYNLYYSSHPDLVGGFWTGVRLLGIPLLAALTGVGVAFWRTGAAIRGRPIEPMAAWLCADFVIEVIFSGLSGRALFHYYLSWMPFMAVGTAMLVHEAARRWTERWPRYEAAAMAVALVVLVIGYREAFITYGETARQLIRSGPGVQRIDAASRYVNAHTEPDETVLVWGAGGAVNFLSRRDSPTAYFLYWDLAPSPVTDRVAARFLEDVRARRPALIVDLSQYDTAPLSTEDPLQWYASRGFYAQPHMEEFFDFVHANYEHVTDVGDVEVYEVRR